MDRPLAGRLILVVEDEPLIALHVSSALEQAGGQITSTSLLRNAMLLAEHGDLSAAVIDHVLGDGDSSLLCKLLTERDIPFVIHSGASAIDIAERHSAPYIPKPADPEVIVATVAKLIDGRKISN